MSRVIPHLVAPAPRPLAVRAAALAIVGVVVGVAWWAVMPTMRGWSDGIERAISGEVAFAGLGLAVGIIVAVVGLVRPGPDPAAALAVVIVGSLAGSLIAWGVGRVLGAPVIAATGVLVVWPLATATVTAAATLVLSFLAGSDPAEPESTGAADPEPAGPGL